MAYHLIGTMPLPEQITGFLLNGPLETDLDQNTLIVIQENAIEMSFVTWRPFCLCLNVL